KESGSRETLLDLRVGPAEAGGEFRAELRPVSIPHDHRGHSAGPAQVVAVQRGEQLLDVRLAEAPLVAVIIEIARRGSHQHQGTEPIRLAGSGEYPDHGTDRMA